MRKYEDQNLTTTPFPKKILAKIFGAATFAREGLADFDFLFLSYTANVLSVEITDVYL